jgi:methanogenic corrinoid protein MtbC1
MKSVHWESSIILYICLEGIRNILSMRKLEPAYAEIYLENLLHGNREKCAEISLQYVNETSSVQQLYEDVFKPALYEVGKLWEHNKISVASEHLATAITERIMNELYEKIAAVTPINKKVVLACVENEQHQVGIKMAADIFELHGWESFFLGTGIPLKELISFIEEVDPQVIAISLSVYFNFKNLIKTLDILEEKFPGKKIIAGGQAFNYIDDSFQNKFGLS